MHTIPLLRKNPDTLQLANTSSQALRETGSFWSCVVSGSNKGEVGGILKLKLCLASVVHA
jgi:hypothetical protein